MKPMIIDSLTKKFILAVEDLKKKGIIKRNIELSSTIGFSPGNLSRVLNGKRNIPFKYAFEFARQYQILELVPKEPGALINLPVAPLSGRIIE